MRKRLALIIEEAAKGRLPDWGVVSSPRYQHMTRVSSLLGKWTESLDLPEVDAIRWRASGYLHDALREYDPETLRSEVSDGFKGWPSDMLHGPAAAERLGSSGVIDDELVLAITYHSLGHPSLNRLGRALYSADFLEPGRMFRVNWCKSLRERMPEQLDEVTAEIVAARINHAAENGMKIYRESIGFQNVLVNNL